MAAIQWIARANTTAPRLTTKIQLCPTQISGVTPRETVRAKPGTSEFPAAGSTGDRDSPSVGSHSESAAGSQRNCQHSGAASQIFRIADPKEFGIGKQK